MRLLKENCICLIVDVQERLVPVMYQSDNLVATIDKLLNGLLALEVPFLLSEQYKKGLGTTIDSIEQQVENCPRAEKIAFSCCDEPRLMETLELSKKRVVLICGIETHVCVLQTAIDLKEMGFIPVVIEDCVSSRTIENKSIAIQRMRQEGVIITSYESLLFELCRDAGTEVFKTISKIVK